LFGKDVGESLRNSLVYDTTIESIYLCGNFGVYSKDFKKGTQKDVWAAESFYIGQPPKLLSNTLLDGFPFFAGNVTINTTFNANSDNVKLKLNGRFHFAEVTVNSQRVGTLMFTDIINVSPYVVKGKNRLEIKLYSGNRNLLGPHHIIGGDMDTEVVPSSFDFSESWSGDSSPEFTSRYSFAKFGLFDK
jgi:hypothetical protein